MRPSSLYELDERMQEQKMTMKSFIMCLSGLMLLILMVGVVACNSDFFARATLTAVPSAYSEVVDEYTESRGAILAKGQEIVNLLIEGDIASVRAQFSKKLGERLSENELQTMLRELRTNRVHLEIDHIRAVFDGHVEGDTISGIFAQRGSTGTFHLERATRLEPDRPITGRWDGKLLLRDKELVITINIDSDGEELKATIDIPGENAKAVPLANVSYNSSVEIGGFLGGLVWPISPYYRHYIAEYSWGDQALAIRVGFDKDLAISELKLLPRQPLPPDPAASYETNTKWRLPFDGLWWVYWGGPTELQNYHAVNPVQRHACDLLIWKDGGTHKGRGSTNEDYWAFGQPVLAPADGTVVTVLDGLKDNTPGEPNPEPHPAGNHIVIKTGTDEYVFIAHFQQGSIRVQEGDEVKAGDLLGLTGNSGRSFEPHIHIHAQTQADYFSRDAIGLPLVFSDYLADGHLVRMGVPIQGQFIQPALSSLPDNGNSSIRTPYITMGGNLTTSVTPVSKVLPSEESPL